MISIPKKLYCLLTKKERRHAIALLFAILFVGILEALGVASILPFITILTNPHLLETNQKLAALYSISGTENYDSFFRLLTGGVLVIIILANFASAATQWAISWFTNIRSDTLSIRLLNEYMRRPYIFFLENNSAGMAKNILVEVTNVIKNVLMPTMQVTIRIVICFFILLLLLFVDPRVTLSAITVFGGAYFLIYFTVRKKLAHLGEKRVESNTTRHRSITEIFAGIKDIKILGREKYYIDRYSKPSLLTAQHTATQENISMLPRYFLETIAFGGVLAVLMYLMKDKGNMTEALPTIAVFAFAGQRLMPALQQIFMNITKIRFSAASLEHIIKEIGNGDVSDLVWPEKTSDHLAFKNKLSLNNIFFRYGKQSKDILNGINLEIKPNLTIGFVGGTGAGKTTLLDIILGLLQPTQGAIFVDEIPITQENLRQWQNMIGYVSQHIVLFDDTITNNITCGLPEDQINFEAVKHAAKLAHIDDFIEKELANGYETMIGENGIRLSGGQRQRIGIARALYNDPPIVIFDEATSALDNVTEQVVMDAINNLTRQKTILMIAHRLTTVKSCDIIYVLENGQIIASGTYDDLYANCLAFQLMAKRV